MAKMKFIEEFTLEVPLSNGENDIIKGQLLPATQTLKNQIKEKYKERDKLAKETKKKQDKIQRLAQKADNIEKRLDFGKDILSNESKLNLLAEQQKYADEAYILSDEVEEQIKDDIDIYEVVSKEHIQSRVKCDEENKVKLTSICEKYSYKLVYETILKDIEEQGKKEQKNL